ncbi:hypothetical protein V6N13_019790 [Hibiscus sabdariffa]
MAESLLAKLGDLNFTAEEQDAVVVSSESVAIPAEDFACSLVANVLKRGPWEFQKHWFALEQADPMRTIHDYSFQYMSIWVRIHNIPLSLMTAELARTLGACIGKVIMTDTRLEDCNMGEFMRVRVSFDTTKPLRRCVVLSRPGAKAIMCPLQYERLHLFCHGCGLLGHAVLGCTTITISDGQKLQCGAWLRAPQPKRPIAVRPRGRISLVDDAAAVPASNPSTASGSPIAGGSVPAQSPASDAATRHATGSTPPAPVTSDVPATGGTPPAPVTSDTLPACTPATVGQEQDMYDPMVHFATSDMLEDALAMPTDCALLVDIYGVVQSHGEDLVHDAIDAAADTLIREVAASVLGCAPISVDTDAAVVSATSAAMTSASPTAPVLSRSAPACARRLPMPALPEHQEFDAWYAAQTRQASTSRSDQPDFAQALRAPKRHASHSDPTKAKRPRPSTSSRIPLIPKAGMSSANNSSAETARQSRREK